MDVPQGEDEHKDDRRQEKQKKKEKRETHIRSQIDYIICSSVYWVRILPNLGEAHCIANQED